MKCLLSVSLLLPLLGCVSARNALEMSQTLPTANEVIAHVREHWGDDYSLRFASIAARRGQTAELLAVDTVKCNYYYDIPDCSFQVTARFEGGPERTMELSSSFDRDDEGRLKAVLLLVHERPR